MNTGTIKTISIILFGGVVIFLLFSQKASLRESKQLNDALRSEIDSLRAISGRYVSLQKEYESLYSDLSGTRQDLLAVREKMRLIAGSHTGSVNTIKRELNNLILTYDSMDLMVDIDTSDLKEIRF